MMRNKIRTLFVCSLMVLSGIASAGLSRNVCDVSTFNRCKSERSVALSLLHLNTMLKKASLSCPDLEKVCGYITKNRMTELFQTDVQNMVRELVAQLRTTEKRLDDGKEEQQVCAFIRKFLGDCTDLVAKRHAVARAGVGPCFSELVVQSLEACDVLVVGDLTVEGQIINPCCDGTASGPVGPTGPTGATGLTGPTGVTGSTGADATSESFLFASLTDGTDSILLTSGEEAVVPLSIVTLLTDLWTENIGTEGVSFVAPEDAIYQISYDLRVELSNTNGDSFYSADAWVELLNGTAPGDIAGSRFNIEQTGLTFPSAIKLLSNTFFVSLSSGDMIQLRFANTASGTSSGVYVVSLPLLNGNVANLVVTKIK